MGLAVMMGVQTPAMAIEISQEAATQEQQIVEPQTEVPLAEEVETTEVQMEEISTEKVETEENQTEEAQSETQTIEVQAETQAEEIQTQELEIAEPQQTEDQEQETLTETSTEASIEELIDQYALTENQEVLTDGWHQDSDGNYMYVKDGAYLTNTIAEINGSYYGFDYNGVMYADTDFSFWDLENGRNVYYRAKSDGSLYVNEWCTPVNCDPYYYGEGGKAYTGLQEVDGTLYYFDYDGESYRNRSVTTEIGELYYCDSTGKATKIENDGWLKADGKYLYVKDGKFLENCVEKIGDAYYGFSSWGTMYADDYFVFEDSESQCSIFYRAKSDGSLYVNEWYTSEYGNVYYYGEKGKAYTGLQEIDGTLYHFRGDGEIDKNKGIKTETGELYYCDSTGKATKVENNGWFETEGKYLYVKEGRFLENCVEKIENAYYGFDNHGIMYTDWEFGSWDWESQRNFYYRAKKDGVLYANEWYMPESGAPYYYGEDAKAYSGLHEVEGIFYCFSDSGQIYKNQMVTTEDGENYYCDEDGKATKVENNGWFEIDGKQFYVKDGRFLERCVEKIGDAYYGFNYNGIMYEDAHFDLWDSESERYIYYRAKSDGSLYVNEWYTPEYENPYYYGNEGKAYTGLNEVDGTLYYFSNIGQIYKNQVVTTETGENYYCDSTGKATKIENNGWFEADGKYLYAKDGKFLENCVEKIGDAYYGFNYNGIMYEDEYFDLWDSESQRSIYYRAKSDGSLYVNEWYKSQYGDLYYYGEEGKAYFGLHEIDGIQYYFYQTGEIYKNKSITTEDGELYYCDSTGKATKVEGNGWFEADGNYLYVKDGKFLEGCVEKIGDVYYGFNYNGIMYADVYFDLWDSESQRRVYYRAKEDGSLYVNEWYTSKYSDLYYYGEGGKAYSGLYEIDGTQYYFSDSGEAYKNRGITTEDGELYYCDSNGKATKIEVDGWFEADGKYLYVKDGKFLTSSVVQSNGVYYGFDYNGIMYTDTTFLSWSSEDGVSNYYRAKQDGSLYVNEWYESYTTKFYYGEGGKAYSGLKTVDGKQYYFYHSGEVAKNYCTSVDGKNIYCDNYGIVYELNDGGWNKIDDDYLYVKDGEVLRECVVQINGVYYAFNSSGVMYHDVTFNMWSADLHEENWYWASPSGALYTNTWSDSGYSMYYYGADAKRCKGVQTIDGVQYGFDSRGNLVMSETLTIDGVNYYCDEEGRTDVIPDNQWYKDKNGYWYYSLDGTLLRNCSKQIGNTWYRFDDHGKMQTHGLNVNADGSLRINTWVYDGDWHYYGEDGQAYGTGIFEIAGVTYYFKNEKMITSKVISFKGTSYIADANGYLTKIPENGWIQAGSDYYYAEDGKLVTLKVKEINGAYYAFDNSGKMVTDGEYLLLSGRCRARADGSLYVSQWYQDLAGSWYYYDQNAMRVIDKAEINGTHYLFDTTNALKTNGVVQRSGKYYLADENGIWVQTPGWVQKNNCWYYVQQDGTLYQGILKDGGYTYYMSPRMVTDLELTKVDDTVYTIDRNGHASVAADGFYNCGLSNGLYYISDGKSAEKGWKQINGSWYYFGDTGINGMYWAAADSTNSIDGKYYRFNSDGTLASVGWHIESSGKWYYVDASGALATGDTWLNGTLYHFNEDGELKTGAIVENGKCNVYSDDGTLLESGAAQGWNYIGGAYYYLKGDSLLKGSHKLEDGKWYTFDSEGRMQVNAQVDGRWYGESGAAKTGWFTVAGEWYYASTMNGHLYKGLHTINGVQYYFDNTGVMQTGEVVSENHVLTINDSGVVTGTKEMQDGWSCYDEEWYYYQNGKPYTGWVGAYYIDAGKMLCNSGITWNDKMYYLGEDGTYKTNAWILDGQHYAKADGLEAQSEWLEMAGNLYYFNSWGANIKYPNYYSEAKETGVYREDGAYISSEGYAQGWALIDGSYYYKEGENFVVNQTKKINGDWYLFDAHGKMVTGFSTYEYDSSAWVSYYYDWGKFYYGQDGRRCYYVGWQVIDGKWYYFDTASESVSGWQIINGVRYYFDTESHAMVTGYQVINEKLYYFDANGVCQGVSGPQNGWYQADGNWYYIRGGRALTSERTVINNAWYEFDEKGVWVTE